MGPKVHVQTKSAKWDGVDGATLWQKVKREPRFGIMGFGPAGKRHARVAATFGVVSWVYDPYVTGGDVGLFPASPSGKMLKDVDYVVIATPTYNHKELIDICLQYPVELIVEKPLVLPWEELPDSKRVNIVLQYRYADLALTDPRKIVNTFIRDKDWWDSWKGTPELSGGLIYTLHIHYIDLALRYGMAYEGHVLRPHSGAGAHRTVSGYDSTEIFDSHDLDANQDNLYKELYSAILSGNGIKPDEIRYLMYTCDLLNAQFRNNTAIYMPSGGYIK